jgi:ABC-2 type transport system permease protein
MSQDPSTRAGGGAPEVSAWEAGRVIAARTLRARLRDRSAIVVAFVAPLVLAAILSLALGGGAGFSTTLGVVDDDGGELATFFVDQVLGGPRVEAFATVEEFPTEAAGRAAVEDGTVNALFLVPAGFTAAATGAEGADADTGVLTVVRSSDRPLTGDLATGIAEELAANLEVQREAVALALGAGADFERVPEIIAAAAAEPPAVALGAADEADARTSAASYFGPAMAVFFVFFVVAQGPASLLRERRQGTLARLHASPAPPEAILLGTAAAVLVLALASITVMWLVTSLAFRAAWGAPAGVILLAVAIVLAAAGITALIATTARTDQQVDGWTSITVFTLALLGGSFSNINQMPVVLQRLALLTPNGWAMRGFSDLAAGQGFTSVLLPVAAILAFAAVTTVIALRRSHRLVAP